jgi:hypothetical protein
VLDTQVTLTTATLLNLIRRRQGEPHTVLSSTPVWQDEGAQRQANERADAELAGYGLAGPRGVEPSLLATVDVIARPALEFYAWINGGHEGHALNYTLLAGSGGREAFVLARNTDHEGVVIASLRPEELLDGFLNQLPRLAPGKGQPLLVPKSAVTGGKSAGQADDDGYDVLRGARRTPETVATEELRRVLGLRRLGGGSLYVAGRGRSGVRQRAERPVNYIDTVEGRWLTEEVPGSGEPLIALTPATPQLLAERLRHAQNRLGL